MRASDVMRKGIVTVSPELDLADFEELLTGEDISGAPVLDEQGRLIGIATKTDVVRGLSEAFQGRDEIFSPQLSVADVMTPDVVCVGPDEDVRAIAQRMIDGQLHRVLVVDAGQILGIVTSFDLLRLVA